MKLSTERTAFLKALSRIQRIVERGATAPILSNVLLTASGSTLGLRASDGRMDVADLIPCDVVEAGATTLAAHTLHDIVRKLDDGAIVSLDDTQSSSALTLKSGRSRFKLSTLPAADYPDITTGDLSTRFTIAGPLLKRLLEKTLFAISSEETRYYLTGAYLHFCVDAGKPYLRAAATDGHRLARVQIEAPAGSDKMHGVIVPKKTVTELLRLLDEAAPDVLVEISTNKIRFTVGAVVLVSKLIDGTFPDYERVIPRNNDQEIIAPRDAFRETVDRVSTVASERGRAITLTLSDETIRFSMRNPDAGAATEELEVVYGGPPLEIGFNARYLMDIVSQIDGPDLLIRLADASAPAILADRADPNALFVVMPVRT